MDSCDVATEIRRILILMRRKLRDKYQSKKICEKCYNEFLNIILDLELKLEEYEYEEALRRWG